MLRNRQGFFNIRIMHENQIIRAAVDALTGKVVHSFTLRNRVLELKRRSFFQWLLRRKNKVVFERTFNISPCVVANQYRIAAKALTLPIEVFEDYATMLRYVPEHLPTIIYIIAAAITNTYEEPDSELIEYLERNLDNEDVLEILSASLQATNMQSFLTSIVLMNGVAKVLKTSPQDGRELIASHNQTSDQP